MFSVQTRNNIQMYDSQGWFIELEIINQGARENYLNFKFDTLIRNPEKNHIWNQQW